MNAQIKNTARRLMSELKYWLVDEIGEMNATLLAEAVADELRHGEWLNDETHPVWEITSDLAEDYNRVNHQ